MRFLTVAERELRAAARRRGTHRLRWITAALFWGLLVWLTWVLDGFSRRGAAINIFQAYSTLTFIYCIIVGTAVTADCLSSERREGTLGLLFLTNLNSAEIVAGKFCSTALSAVYGLAAIFPMLALPMLMGGITLQYFWKTILALIVTIFFSMAAGFVATTFCRKQFTAIAVAMGLGVSFGAGLMGVAAILNSLARKITWADELAAFCPLYTLLSAEGTRVFGKNHYWYSLLAVTGMALIWLALVIWRLSRAWRDQPKGRSWSSRFPILQRWGQHGGVLWEGLVQHQWTEPQLAEFQKELAGFNFLSDYTNAVQRVVLAHIEIWRARSEAKQPLAPIPQAGGYVNPGRQRWQPRAWWLASCIQLQRAGQHAIDKVDVAAGRVGVQPGWNDLSGLPLDSESQQLLQQHTWMGANPVLVSFAQNAVNQAIIACALERFFLAHGRYPDGLETLQPGFLGKIPNDPIRGRPMMYQRVDDRHFILRGAGPNEVDDRKNPSSDDWLWSSPTNAPVAK